MNNKPEISKDRMPETRKAGKTGWTLFIIFAVLIMVLVSFITRLTCSDLEKEITAAMLKNKTQHVGIFKIEKTENGKNLISLGD